MDECKCTLSKRLTGDGCRYCQPQEYIDRMGEWLDEERADINAKDAEIERLNALVAMQAEALKTCSSDWADGCYGTLKEQSYDAEKVLKALSATAETVSAWQSKRDNDILISELEKLKRQHPTDSEGCFIHSSCIDNAIAELRTKGE